MVEIGFCRTSGISRSESVRSEIQLLYSFMKYDYEKLILPSFREFNKLSIDTVESWFNDMPRGRQNDIVKLGYR